MHSEADTCRKFVVPLLQSAGGDEEWRSIGLLRKTKKDFFAQYGPEARQILDELLEK